MTTMTTAAMFRLGAEINAAKVATRKLNASAPMFAYECELNDWHGVPAPARRIKEDRTLLLEQVITYNELADKARAMKIKGLSAKRLGRQASPTFRSLAIGAEWIRLIQAEITAHAP